MFAITMNQARLHLVPQQKPTFSRIYCTASTIYHFAVPKNLLSSYASCQPLSTYTPSDHYILEL